MRCSARRWWLATVLVAVAACSAEPLPQAPQDATAVGTDGDAGKDTGPAADATATAAAPTPHADWVDPFIGTGMTLANIGSSYPGAARPFGLVKASPDTSNDAGMGAVSHCGGYQYIDPYIHGISHNHLQGTGVPDYGNLAVMPVVAADAAMTTRTGRRSPFSHASEEAHPGYYAVTLDGPQVRAEVTATAHCAQHRYRFLAAGKPGVLSLDLGAAIAKGRSTGGALNWDAEAGVWRGWTHNHGEFSGRYKGFDVFFVARFDRPAQQQGGWLDGVVLPGAASLTSQKDPTSLGLWAQFDTAVDQVVQLQVCLSYVDIQGAALALQQELPDWDFAARRQEALLHWEKDLGVVDVQGGSDAEKIIFYSSLYRALQLPTLWSDVDGRYRGFDGKVHTATGWRYYTDLSLWDTFRTENPLIVLLYPEVGRDVLRSLQAMAEQGGSLPKWPMGMGDTGSMIGQHSVSVIADTWLKDPQGADIELLYGVSKQIAEGKLTPGLYGARDCVGDWLAQGWCAKDKTSGSVSKTLEYAFNDHCLARLATRLGKTSDATAFAARAQHYAKLWDPASQFFRARTSDGAFASGFDPLGWDFENAEYVEGTAWQWLWFVPHDPAGLRTLFGGEAPMLAKLQAFFELAKENFNFVLPSPYYFHGNEPDILAPALFHAAGRPDLADLWTRWVGDSSYTTAPDGLVGNDDAGTLSAWYVLAALGLMPRPCEPGFDLVAPRFAQATVRVPGHPEVIISAAGGAGSDGVTPTWKAKGEAAATPLPQRWIEQVQLRQGGALGWAAK